MTTPELENRLRKIVSDWNEWKDEEGYDYEDAVNRPPATTQQIADLEKWLGRSLSPSYRHFLSVQNGLKLGNQFVLLGTEDYYSDFSRNYIALINQTMFEVLGENTIGSQWLRSLPESVFEPQNLYPMLDGKTIVPSELQAIKDFSAHYNETRDKESWLFFPHHIVIGYHDDIDFYVLMECGSESEKPIHDYKHGNWGVPFANVYEYLKAPIF